MIKLSLFGSSSRVKKIARTFEANRTGFNQKLEVGETIEYKDKNYIIIGIYNTRINRIGDPRITRTWFVNLLTIHLI